MKIHCITGLGNHDPRYDKTRHNVGFMFLDQLIQHLNLSWKKHSTQSGLYCAWQHPKGKILIFKPTKLMNINGGPIVHFLHYHKIEPQNALVAFDDLSFDPGTIKMKSKGGHGGHNGVRDILAHLPDQNFYRLKFGIGRPTEKNSVSQYVLSAPNANDSENIQKAIAYTIENIDNIIDGQLINWQNQNQL